MDEQNTYESFEKTDYGLRSPLLMPIIEGKTLDVDDLADFLGSRLSFLQEWSNTHPVGQLG